MYVGMTHGLTDKEADDDVIKVVWLATNIKFSVTFELLEKVVRSAVM